MKVGAIVLSRFSSNRLPGKALLPLMGKPVLLYIIERLLTVIDPDQVIIATSSEPSDDPIATFGESLNLRVFRGSLDNVAERFLTAGEFFGFDYAVRINGDNIFVDTELFRKMIGFAREEKYDFISNVKNRTFPKGMSIEIVRLAYYRSLYPEICKSKSFMEHVTLFLYDDTRGAHYYVMNEDLPEAGGIQLALDTVEDFKRCEEIVGQFTDSHVKYNLHGIFKIWKQLNYDQSF